MSDHAIDGKPVLPGVIGLEMMAAVAMMADPGHGYAGAEEVSYKSPVKLHGDAVTDARAVDQAPRLGDVETDALGACVVGTGSVVLAMAIELAVVGLRCTVAEDARRDRSAGGVGGGAVGDGPR